MNDHGNTPFNGRRDDESLARPRHYDGLALALIVSMWAASAWALWLVGGDARVPVHFNVQGEADRWAHARFGLCLLPALALGTAVLMKLLPRFDPKGANLLRSANACGAIGLAVTALLALVHAVVVSHAVSPVLGKPLPAQSLIPVGLGLLLIVIGNLMGKLRWNHSVGIRTPWTLADERVWDQTHRYGGRLMVLGGCLLLLALAVPALHAHLGWWIVTVTLAVVGLTVLKSYRLWRAREQR